MMCRKWEEKHAQRFVSLSMVGCRFLFLHIFLCTYKSWFEFTHVLIYLLSFFVSFFLSDCFYVLLGIGIDENNCHQISSSKLLLIQVGNKIWFYSIRTIWSLGITIRYWHKFSSAECLTDEIVRITDFDVFIKMYNCSKYVHYE